MNSKEARQLVQKMAAEKGITITKKQCQSWQGDPKSGLGFGDYNYLLNAIREGVTFSHVGGNCFCHNARVYILNCDPSFTMTVGNKEMIAVLDKLCA